VLQHVVREDDHEQPSSGTSLDEWRPYLLASRCACAKDSLDRAAIGCIPDRRRLALRGSMKKDLIRQSLPDEIFLPHAHLDSTSLAKCFPHRQSGPSDWVLRSLLSIPDAFSLAVYILYH
jgi:hypothetical protein